MNNPGGTHNDHEIGFCDALLCNIPLFYGQVLTKPHHTWSNQPSALFTLWRSKACNGFLRIVFIVFPWSRTIRAPVFKQAAMKMRHIARASSLVQVVNVLGGDVNVFDGVTPLPVGN